MTKWTLTYFELYGRAEAARMAMTHGGIDFNDNTVTGESWTAFKNSDKCPNGQLPVLEVEDGKCLNQSEAIVRFIGHKTGAYPTKDPLACHQADAIINTCTDFETRAPKTTEGKPMIYKMFGNEAIGEEDLSAMVDHRKLFHEGMVKILGDDAFFGGTTPSIADFWLCASIWSWERNAKGKELQAHVYAAYKTALEENIKLNAWADRMGEELKDYFQNRRTGCSL